MYTEDSNTGFLGNLKNLFSAKKTNPTEEETANREVTETLVEEYIPIKNPNPNVPTDRPMGTRTVDYSHIEFTPISKPTETSEQPVINAEEPKSSEELDILFASMLIEKGGKFIFCDTISDAVTELENSNAAMCLCETLVADTGSLILSPKQASRRRLPVFPRVQIFLADTTQIAADLNKAIDLFNLKNRGELPSVLDLADNAKGHYYHDGNLVLKAEGTSEIYVFLVDEKIKPSLRS